MSGAVTILSKADDLGLALASGDGGGGESVISRNGRRAVVNGKKAAGQTAPHILVCRVLEICVERRRTGVEGGAVLFVETLDAEGLC